LDKPFKTLDEQIDILIKRNLVIKDIDQAKFSLTKHGYYSIINGYKDIFLKEKANPMEEDCFSDNVNFTDLINLYYFDVRLRNEILSALESIEGTLQSNIAYILSEKFGYKQTDYLCPTNFKVGRRTRNGRTEREVLLEQLGKICGSEEHPMKHYRSRYGNIPPWILAKGLTFGNIIYIYKLFKKEEKDYLISRCLGTPINEVDEKLKEFFSKMLDIFRRYRNWAAHGGRIYSHKVREELPYYPPVHQKYGITRGNYNKGQGKNDIMGLCLAMFFFMDSYFHGSVQFFAGLDHNLEHYKKRNPGYYPGVLKQMGFPSDYEESFFKDKVLQIDTNSKSFLARIQLSSVSPNTIPQ